MSQKIKTDVINGQNIIARECRFAVHIPTKSHDIPDYHLVKEQCHTESGELIPNIRIIKDYQRPFWVTKKGFQNHVDKKEYEKTDHLNKFMCTQSRLRETVAQALDKAWSKEGLRQLSSSPYLYGSDITSSTLIKKQYMMQYPNVQTGFSIAYFDIETDVVRGTKEAIMATVVFKNKVFTAIQKSFISGISNVIDRVDVAMDKYLAKYIKDLNLECETVVCDNEIDMLRAAMAKVHQWKPDFFAIWNMDFDIPRVVEACERAGIDPKDLFSDPSIPPELRFFKYKQGQKKKVTASGKEIPINPAAQWHWVHVPSSFFIIDAMCCYKQIRMAKQEEPSYSLDAILTKELKIQKLKFTEADAYQGLRWHQFMQTEYKIEYIIYNRFDCIAMLLLDDKTKDLAFTIPSYSDTSDFAIFKSQPKRISDSLFFTYLEEGNILGVVGAVDEDEEPDVTLGLDGWIKNRFLYISTR